MRIGLIALAGLAASLTVACRDATQITLIVSTDIACDAPFGGAGVVVGVPGGILDKAASSSSTSCDPPQNGVSYVGRLVVAPAGAKDAEVEIEVIGARGHGWETCQNPTLGPGCVVARRALHFTPEKNLQLPVLLESECVGIACKPDETCVRGACISSAVTCDDTGTCPSLIDGGPAPDGGPPDGGPIAGPSGCDWPSLTDPGRPMFGNCPTRSNLSAYSALSSGVDAIKGKFGSNFVYPPVELDNGWIAFMANQGSLFVYDRKADKVGSTPGLRTDEVPIVALKDGSLLFTTTLGDEIVQLKRSGPNVTDPMIQTRALLPSTEISRGITVDSKGNWYVATSAGVEVYAGSVNANPKLWKTTSPPTMAPSFTKKGELAVVATDHLEVFDATGNRVLSLMFASGTTAISPPVVGPEGNIYVATQGNGLTAIEAFAVGKVSALWRASVSVCADAGATPAVDAQGNLYVATCGPKTSYVSLTSLGMKSADGPMLGGVVHSTPLIDATGRVFVTTDAGLRSSTPGKALKSATTFLSSGAILSDGTWVLGGQDGNLYFYRNL